MTDKSANPKSKLPLDVPSETAKTGLPTVGEGATARDYAKDAAPKPGQKTPHQKRDDD